MRGILRHILRRITGNEDAGLLLQEPPGLLSPGQLKAVSC